MKISNAEISHFISARLHIHALMLVWVEVKLVSHIGVCLYTPALAEVLTCMSIIIYGVGTDPDQIQNYTTTLHLHYCMDI